MGLFKKTAEAKASSGRDYAKEGRYMVILDRAKYDRHSLSQAELVAFETRVVHVLDCPKDEKGNPTVKPGEPCSFVFKDGTIGNEARLKSFLLVAAGEPGTPIQDTPDAISEADMKVMVDPAVQPLKDVILEIHASKVTTRAQKVITASRATRQVPPEELLSVIDPKAKAELFPNGALEALVGPNAEAKVVAHRLAK